ncbi:hypothetical protein ACWPM1_11560 [Tsuneonella sp. HG249]
MKYLAAMILPITLLACQQSPQDSATTEGANGAADAAPAVSPSDTASVAPTPAGVPGEGEIPSTMQGRWGMVPADCTSTRGDAKGLLRISPTTLTFYESVGRLASIMDRSDSSIRAEYAFTGEGMEWKRDIELKVSGDTLTRTDRGGEEPGGPFTYTKCAA